MARLRRGLANAFNTTSQMINFILQKQILSDIALKQAEANRKAQFQNTLLQKALEKPEFAEGLERAGASNVGGLPISALVRTTEQRLKPLGAGISGATDIAHLPTEADIVEQASLEGVGVDPQLGKFALPGQTDSLLPGPVQSLLNQRGQKLNALRKTDTKPVTSYDANSGTTFTGYHPVDELTSLGALPDAPTPEQKGENFLKEQLAGAFSPEMTTAKIGQENAVLSGTSAARASSAARTAGAETRARLGQEFAPDIVNARVGQASQIAEAQARAQAQNRIPSDAERKAAQSLSGLMQAEAVAKNLELSSGAEISPLALQVSQSPGLGKLGQLPGVGKLFQVHPKDQAYVQAAKQWTNTYAYTVSGVTVREDEFPRYLSTFFRVTGDSPDVLAQKQRARAVYERAAQIAAGGAKTEAGRLIGQAIANGMVDPKILTAIPIDPQIAAGVNATLGIPSR